MSHARRLVAIAICTAAVASVATWAVPHYLFVQSAAPRVPEWLLRKLEGPKHHHTVYVTCPTWVTSTACTGAYFDVSQVVWSSPVPAGGWHESFRIPAGQTVSFTFTNLTHPVAHAIDLAAPHLICKSATSTELDKVDIVMDTGASVTSAAMGNKTFTEPLDYAGRAADASFVIAC